MRSTLPPLTGLLMLGLGGCVSFHPAGPIGAPSETAQSTYPHAVQVEEVQITDRKITNADWRRTVSAALTQQIGQHVERGEYFGRLISFPAKVEGNDVVLKFSFSARRQANPASRLYPRCPADTDCMDLGERPNLRGQVRSGR